MIIYVIHNPENKEREEYINNLLNDVKSILKIEVKHIWNKSGKELTDEEVSKFKDFNGSRSSQTKIRNASSLCLHHMSCLKDFIETEYDNCIIFEDDCYIVSLENFTNAIAISKETEFDSIYLGEGCQPNIHKGKSQGLIPTVTSRCTESILYSKEGSKKIIDYFDKTQDEKTTCCHLDFFFNIAYPEIENYKNFHYHPAPIKQGTQNGKFNSTIQ
jgi:hypothetical protein